MTLVWTGYSLYYSYNLEASEDEETFLVEDHWILRNLDYYINGFQPGAFDVFIVVNFIFGAKDLDKSGTSYWDPADVGKVVHYEDFDLSSEAA